MNRLDYVFINDMRRLGDYLPSMCPLKKAEDDGAALGDHNMNSTRDINSHGIEQDHSIKSIMMHTDSVNTKDSSPTAHEITSEYEHPRKKMYRSTEFGI